MALLVKNLFEPDKGFTKFFAVFSDLSYLKCRMGYWCFFKPVAKIRFYAYFSSVWTKK